MFLLVIKTGSLPGEAGYKDGMPVTILPADAPLSKHMLKVYAIVKLDDSLKPDVIDARSPLMDSSKKKRLRATSGYLDLEEVAELLDSPSLVERWRGSEVVPVQDGSHITKEELTWYETKDELWDEGDANQVTSGSYTVGTGMDYADWAAAIADVGSPLTGDLAFTQMTDTTETGQNLLSDMDLGGHTLTFESGSPHHGDPTAGHKMTLNPSGTLSGGIEAEISGTGLCVVKDLNLKSAAASPTDGVYGLRVRSAGPDVQMHDCMVDTTNLTTGTGFNRPLQLHDSDGASASTDLHCWNCTTANPDNANGVGVSLEVGYNAVIVVENVTAKLVGAGRGIDCLSTVVTVRNCCAFGPMGGCFYGIGNADGFNNACQDTTGADGNWSTGTGNKVSITPADEFYSTDEEDSNWAKVRRELGGVCHDGGTTPTIAGNTVGIRGNPRPHSPDVSVGADELGGGAGSFGGRPAWAW